jgi:CheY-like chemotaxis protein
VLGTANTALDADYAAHHAEVTPGEYVVLEVSDTGTGIAPEALKRVFEPFFTTKGSGKGTGLGLAMVYGFVKQSRGHVNIYSEPGEGTTVRLYLPRAGSGAEPESLPADTEIPVGGAETVLVVEDDELVRGFVVQQLRGLGYEVREAENAAAALAILESSAAVDLLFTDVVMPGGMNGRELAEAASALRPGLRVLFTSGYSENAIVHHGRLDPGVQLLAKPYRAIDLARRLREVLAR